MNEHMLVLKREIGESKIFSFVKFDKDLISIDNATKISEIYFGSEVICSGTFEEIDFPGKQQDRFMNLLDILSPISEYSDIAKLFTPKFKDFLFEFWNKKYGNSMLTKICMRNIERYRM